MDTEIEFLRRFESQLSMRAQADARREASSKLAKGPRRWKPYVSLVAALLGLALLVGLAASGGFVGAASSQFNSVGAAVNNPGAISMPGVQANQGQTIFAGRTVHQSAPIPGAPADLPATDAGGTTTSSGNDLQQASSAPAAQQGDLSKIIKDGQIAVTIDKGTFKATAGSVAHIAAVNGGSILSSSTEGGDSGSFTLRVPAANFDKAMLQLAQLGSVDSSASQGQDVTAQYVDLKAHMKIYLSRRRVLFSLMDKATTIGQSLTLQNQLDQVQLKIDQITGQINYINKQVAESTIKVDVHEPGAAAAQGPDTVDNPSLGHAWDRAVQGLLNVIAATLIGLGYLLPLLIVAGIVLLVVRFVRRRRIAADEA